jgi:hypothetical protein
MPSNIALLPVNEGVTSFERAGTRQVPPTKTRSDTDGETFWKVVEHMIVSIY